MGVSRLARYLESPDYYDKLAETSLLDYPRKSDLAKIGNNIYFPYEQLDSNNCNINVDGARRNPSEKNQKQNLMTFCSKQRPFTEKKSRKTARLISKRKWHFVKQLKNAL